MRLASPSINLLSHGHIRFQTQYISSDLRNNGIWQLYPNMFTFIVTVVGATNAKPHNHGDNHTMQP